MAIGAKIELRDLVVEAAIGTYGPGDVVPEAHLLDLTLTVPVELVLIDADRMDRVFDYDPLIAELLRIAADGHYATQERILSRMAAACSAYPQIEAAELSLRKRPVANGSGDLGVRLTLDAAGLKALRA